MRLSDSVSAKPKEKVAILIAGSFEQHGPHLPLSTDTIIAEAVAWKMAEKTGAAVGPTFPVGVSPEHMGFPGTITLTEETFRRAVSEAVASLRTHGFKEVIVVNGHGGNIKALAGTGAKTVNLTSLLKPYDHAGEVETSLIMHLRPELVKPGEIRKHEFKWPGKGGWKDTRDYSASGVLGDPTAATPEKGRAYFERLVSAALDQL